MSNNMYNNYDNSCFDYYTTSNFDNRTKNYLISRYRPNAIWNYGDVFNITFNIKECTDLTTEEIEELEGKKIRVNFYDNRFELIPFIYEVEGSSQVIVPITYEISSKYFKRGIYHCSLEALEYSGEEPTEIETMETLLPMTNCIFYVK